MANHPRLLAIDPSLTCSGWACFCTVSARILAVGKVRSRPPGEALASRIKDVQDKVENLLEQLALGIGDILVCEAQTTVRDPHGAFKVEQVRTIFESVARSRGVKVPGRLNPRSVQSEVLGLRGRQLKREIVKESAVGAVAQLYAEDLRRLGFITDRASLKKHQDIVDAILVASLALSRVNSAKRGKFELEELF